MNDDAIIIEGDNEVVFCYPGIGGLFVSRVDGAIVIEAIAVADPGEPRPVVLARHAELNRRARELFGDDFEARDPLGLRGGPKAVMS